ncbi:MAG: hypothetical protein OEW85_05270 [Acidimicrobiia bacterium]|nr:hypothetical protein [Acidimicrobiia bacterium]
MSTELFQPGNSVAQKHGAWASLENTAEVEALTDGLVDVYPHLADFRSLVATYADLELRLVGLRDHLDTLDPGDPDYRPALDAMLRVEHRCGIRRGECGLSPKARAEVARLLLDVEQGQIGLADLAAAGRSTVPRVGHTEPAAGVIGAGDG